MRHSSVHEEISRLENRARILYKKLLLLWGQDVAETRFLPDNRREGMLDEELDSEEAQALDFGPSEVSRGLALLTDPQLLWAAFSRNLEDPHAVLVKHSLEDNPAAVQLLAEFLEVARGRK